MKKLSACTKQELFKLACDNQEDALNDWDKYDVVGLALRLENGTAKPYTRYTRKELLDELSEYGCMICGANENKPNELFTDFESETRFVVFCPEHKP